MPKKLKWPYIPFHALDAEAARLIEIRKSAATIDGWKGSQSMFKHWCHVYDYCPWDTDRLNNERTFMRFCAYRFKQHGIGSSYARGQVYAVRDLWMNTGLVAKVDKGSMVLLHHMFDGRDKEKPPGLGAKPLTSELVHQMFDLEVMNNNVYDNCIFRVAYSIAHNTFRRVGEQIAQSIGGLRVENIIFIGGENNRTPAPFTDKRASAILVFLFSKRNQLGETQSAPLFHLCQFGEVCAYCELYRLWSFRKTNHWNSTDFLFMFKNKKQLTYNKFNQHLKICAKAIGLDPDFVSSHGFRPGGNIDAKLRGVESNNRNIMAGWRSNKTKLRYEFKMEPQHLHYLVAKDYNIETYPVSTIAFNQILATRAEKIQIRRKKLLKKLKLKSVRKLSSIRKKLNNKKC